MASMSSSAPPPQSKQSPTLSTPGDEKRAQRLIVIGATAVSLGLVLSLTEATTLGALLTLAGLALSIAGLHRYGRAGPRQVR